MGVVVPSMSSRIPFIVKERMQVRSTLAQILFLRRCSYTRVSIRTGPGTAGSRGSDDRNKDQTSARFPLGHGSNLPLRLRWRPRANLADERETRRGRKQ